MTTSTQTSNLNKHSLDIGRHRQTSLPMKTERQDERGCKKDKEKEINSPEVTDATGRGAAILVAQTIFNNTRVTRLDSKNLFHMLTLAEQCICLGVPVALAFPLAFS